MYVALPSNYVENITISASYYIFPLMLVCKMYYRVEPFDYIATDTSVHVCFCAKLAEEMAKSTKILI